MHSGFFEISFYVLAVFALVMMMRTGLYFFYFSCRYYEISAFSNVMFFWVRAFLFISSVLIYSHCNFSFLGLLCSLILVFVIYLAQRQIDDFYQRIFATYYIMTCEYEAMGKEFPEKSWEVDPYTGFLAWPLLNIQFKDWLLKTS